MGLRTFIRQKLCREHDYSELVLVCKTEFERMYKRRCTKCGQWASFWKGPSGLHVHETSDEARSLIQEIAEGKGVWESYLNHRFGSWFYCELPSETASIFKHQGEEAAREFVLRAFSVVG